MAGHGGREGMSGERGGKSEEFKWTDRIKEEGEG